MRKLLTFAAQCHANVVLCCSAAVLLSACGGSVDDSDMQQSLAQTEVGSSAQSTAHAPVEGTGGDIPAAPEPVAAPTVSAAATPAAETAAPAPDGAAPAMPASGDAPASNQFSLSGYQADAAAAPSGAGGEGAAANSADAQQATQLPAA